MTELINELEAELNKLGAAWNLFGMVDKLKSIVAKMKRGSKVPDGWVVFNAGQHGNGEWYCTIGYEPSGKRIHAINQPTFQDALFYCCEQERLSRAATITAEGIPA